MTHIVFQALLTIGFSGLALAFGLQPGGWVTYLGIGVMFLLAVHWLVDVGFFWAVKRIDDQETSELSTRMDADPKVYDLRVSYMSSNGLMIASAFLGIFELQVFFVIASIVSTIMYTSYMSKHHNVGYTS